jgi:hypothetical protein
MNQLKGPHSARTPAGLISLETIVMKILAHPIRLHAVDFDRARKYLAGVEKLAAEGHRTKDPQVLLTALRVMAMQSRTISELGVRV